MSTQTFKFPDQPMADGTVPEIWETSWYQDGRDFSDHGETARLLDALNSPLSVGAINLRVCGPATPEQLAKILKAMAALMVAVSEVGYEMAAAAHEGGEG